MVWGIFFARGSVGLFDDVTARVIGEREFLNLRRNPTRPEELVHGRGFTGEDIEAVFIQQ